MLCEFVIMCRLAAGGLHCAYGASMKLVFIDAPLDRRSAARQSEKYRMKIQANVRQLTTYRLHLPIV